MNPTPTVTIDSAPRNEQELVQLPHSTLYRLLCATDKLPPTREFPDGRDNPRRFPPDKHKEFLTSGSTNMAKTLVEVLNGYDIEVGAQSMMQGPQGPQGPQPPQNYQQPPMQQQPPQQQQMQPPPQQGYQQMQPPPQQGWQPPQAPNMAPPGAPPQTPPGPPPTAGAYPPGPPTDGGFGQSPMPPGPPQAQQAQWQPPQMQPPQMQPQPPVMGPPGVQPQMTPPQMGPPQMVPPQVGAPPMAPPQLQSEPTDTGTLLAGYHRTITSLGILCFLIAERVLGVSQQELANQVDNLIKQDHLKRLMENSQGKG